MSYKKILCFGSLNPDLIYFVDELPKRGDDIRSSNSLIRAGGTAINCAEKIVLWNKLVHVRGNSLGTDPMGNYLIDYLKSKNINTNVYKDQVIFEEFDILKNDKQFRIFNTPEQQDIYINKYLKSAI